MSIIKHVTLQKIVAHDFRYDPRSTISCILFQFPVSSLFRKAIKQLLTSSSSSSRHFYLSLHLSFNNVYYKAVPTQDVTNPVSLPSVYFMWDISVPRDTTLCILIFHTIGPSDLLHPSPVPDIKTFGIFLIYFTKYPSIGTIKSYGKMQHFTSLLLKYKSNFAGGKSLLLLDRCFYHGNHGFNFTCISCIICHHAIQTVDIFHTLQLFLIYHNLF